MGLLSLQGFCSSTLALCITDLPLSAVHTVVQGYFCSLSPVIHSIKQQESLVKTQSPCCCCALIHISPSCSSLGVVILHCARLLRWSAFSLFMLRADCSLQSSRGKRQVEVKLFCSGWQFVSQGLYERAPAPPHPLSPFPVKQRAAWSFLLFLTPLPCPPAVSLRPPPHLRV